MKPKDKELARGIVGSIVAPLFVSIAIGVFVWYTNTVAKAEQDRTRDEKIDALRATEAVTLQKLNQIAEDVAFIRGHLFQLK